VWVVMRGREGVENVFFFFLSTSFNTFFLKRDQKGGMYMRVVMEKNERSVENPLYSVLTECVFILTPCNINAILALIVMNNIRKELVMIPAYYGDQIAAKQSTKSIIISNKSENKINPN